MDLPDTVQASLERPRFVLLNGTLGAGKSTWAQSFLARQKEPWTLIAHDEIAEKIAQKHGVPLNQVFKRQKLYKACANEMLAQLQEALSKGENIIYDNTNISPEWRSEMLKMVEASGHDYYKVAVSLLATAAELPERVANRNLEREAGKRVPSKRAEDHMKRYIHLDLPSIDEGFDIVLQVPSEQFRSKQWSKTVAGTFTGSDRFL